MTGASSGIGEATARAATEAGARVALVARRADRLEALADELDGSVMVTADVTDHGETQAAVDEAAAKLGGIDAVVNNAGTMIVGSPTVSDPSAWQHMLDVNIGGVLAVTHAAVPFLREAKGPSIVNVSSMSGRRVPRPESGVYAASKFAVHALSEAMRQELQPDGIRVTTLAPGFVDTPLADEWTDGVARARWKEGATQGMQSSAVADAIVHVLSLPPEVAVIEYAFTATNQGGGPSFNR